MMSTPEPHPRPRPAIVTPSPDLSVILCTHNGSATILDQVDAVLSQHWDRPFELVVVDNDSTDGVADLVTAHTAGDDRVRVVPAPGRRRLGHAHNVGAEAARGRWITFVDDDDRVGPGWMAALGRALEDHPVVAMRLVLDEINGPVACSVRSHPQVRGVERFCGMPVASMIALSRDLFLAAGGNDEDLTSAEDVDFALRLFQATGVAPHWCEGAVYHYRLRDDPRRSFRQGLSYGRAMPVVYRRWRHHDPAADTAAQARRAVVEWVRLVAMSPLCLVSRRRRLRWAFRGGLRLGRAVGSVRERVVFL